MDLQRWKELETVIKCGSLTAAAEEPAELIEIGLAWEKNLSPVAGKFLEFIRTEGLMP